MRPWRWYRDQTLALVAIAACVWLVAKLTGFM